MTLDEERRFNRMSCKLSDAMKTIARYAVGENTPRRMRELLAETTFHLGMAIHGYKLSISATPAMDKGKIKLLEGQLKNAQELRDLFSYLNQDMGEGGAGDGK